MNTQTLHISKGAFKMESINNISTNTLTNDYCIKQKDKKDIICNTLILLYVMLSKLKVLLVKYLFISNLIILFYPF